MGKSAKLHKRVKTKAKTKTTTQPLPFPEPKPKSSIPAAEAAAQSAKKRVDLRSKAKSRGKSATEGGYILGGADYVTLMLGGRRKAAEEALKLPAKDPCS